jgi:2-polyprenyl-3-methyl-5-hydroxy-6-metoxy-1,4-benzoquinol methylase
VKAALRSALRKNETVTGAVVRAAGRLQSLRDGRLSYRERWSKRRTHESGYWTDSLAAPDARERFADRLDPNTVIAGKALTRAVEEVPREEISILDVGSGPLTSVGKTYPGKQIEVTAADALADEYVEALRKAKIEPLAPVVAVAGEDVASYFGSETFDVTYMSNALDHTADPILVLRNLVDVTKKDGRVALRHMKNEGERNSYFGIHLWNIECRDDRFVIWNRETTKDVATELGDCEVECWTDGADDVEVLIRRR